MVAAGREKREYSTYKVLRWNLESVRALPAPEYDWKWNDVVGTGDDQVHPRLAEKLKRMKSGINPSPRLDGYWRTSPRLGRYIEDRFGVELEAKGQTTLPIDTTPTRGTRDRDADDEPGSDGVRQLDLTGEDATRRVEAMRKQRRIELKKQRRVGGREGGIPTWMRAESDPAQLRLDDAIPTGSEGIPVALTRPTGEYYNSPFPA